ncbi:MAG: AmmeMemoRadiSam system radical SAM enzyme [Proteobacteria bacterium]|nr:AmmeMemoRadiSam system radical SAM enzyme [Pseudomonadota bacterium]
MKSDYPARYWHKMPSGKIQCDLCPRACTLKDGQRGLCFVRQRVGNFMVLTTYGRSSGFCIDPIEKKPLNHFYPSTPVLSFGTAGCNMSCKFCQNWDISRSREFDRLTENADAQAIATAAAFEKCKSVALTYNEPVIFLEYGKDVAEACHKKDINVVAVTNGYINKKAAEEFFSFIDATNVDLKSFSDDFYGTLTGGDLRTVLDTLVYIVKKTNVWLEITTLLVPDENDGDRELQQLAKWIFNELGPDVPLHFSAFHPDFKMREKPATPLKSLIRARDIAIATGLHYVYTGNVYYSPGDTTFCRKCGRILIEREWYNLASYNLTQSGCCKSCGTRLVGRFDTGPGSWGSNRKPIRI